MNSLLTTGEVAKLCGVTPDAVLKWIKKGKLPATRTVGGHYRVSRDACVALGLAKSNGEELPDAVGGHPAGSRIPQRCWEYFGLQGTPPETCTNCLVYQSQAQYCYRLAELCELAGQGHAFCATDCQECPFYRACQGMATTVLVITRDGSLRRGLEKGYDPEKISLHFARSGYESSRVIGKVRPAVVVLDSELPEVREGTLPESIAHDDRIPGAKIFVASRAGDKETVERLALPTLGAPFTARGIERLTERARMDHRASNDAA